MVLFFVLFSLSYITPHIRTKESTRFEPRVKLNHNIYISLYKVPCSLKFDFQFSREVKDKSKSLLSFTFTSKSLLNFTFN